MFLRFTIGDGAAKQQTANKRHSAQERKNPFATVEGRAGFRRDSLVLTSRCAGALRPEKERWLKRQSKALRRVGPAGGFMLPYLRVSFHRKVFQAPASPYPASPGTARAAFDAAAVFPCDVHFYPLHPFFDPPYERLVTGQRSSEKNTEVTVRKLSTTLLLTNLRPDEDLPPGRALRFLGRPILRRHLSKSAERRHSPGLMLRTGLALAIVISPIVSAGQSHAVVFHSVRL